MCHQSTNAVTDKGKGWAEQVVFREYHTHTKAASGSDLAQGPQ